MYFHNSEHIRFILYGPSPAEENFVTTVSLLSLYVADLKKLAQLEAGMPMSVGTVLNFYCNYLPGDNSVAKLWEQVWKQIRRLFREYVHKKDVK